MPNSQTKSDSMQTNAKGYTPKTMDSTTTSLKSSHTSASLQTVSGVQKATVTQVKNALPKVNLKVIQNVGAAQLKQLQEKTGTKYVIVQTSNQGKDAALKNATQSSCKSGTETHTDDTETVDLSCNDEESFLKSPTSNIMINGQRYKIDREIKLNDLVKDNEKATSTLNPFNAAHRDLIAQLPSILKKTIGNRTGTPTKYKIVNVIQTSRPLATTNQTMTTSFSPQIITTSLNFSGPSSVSHSTVTTTSHALSKDISNSSLKQNVSASDRQSLSSSHQLSRLSAQNRVVVSSASHALQPKSIQSLSGNNLNVSSKAGNVNVISITNNSLFNRAQNLGAIGTNRVQNLSPTKSVGSPNLNSTTQHRLQNAVAALNSPLTLNISSRPKSSSSASNQMTTPSSQVNNKPIFIQTNSRNFVSISQSISNNSLAKATQAVAGRSQLSFKLGSRPVLPKSPFSAYTSISASPTSNASSTISTKASNLVPKSTVLNPRSNISPSSGNSRGQSQKTNNMTVSIANRPQPTGSIVRPSTTTSKTSVPGSPLHSSQSRPVAKSPLQGVTNLTIRPVTINNMSMPRVISPSNATLARGTILPARAIIPSNAMMTQRNRTQQIGNNSPASVGQNMPRLQVIHKLNSL